MQFYFIRHAQSTNNALWDQTGNNLGRSEDPAISELGQRQAELLAHFLSQGTSTANALLQGETSLPSSDPQNHFGVNLTHLYTSLMLRAVMTGSIVANRLGLPLLAWKDLHECGGIYLDDPLSGEQVGLPGKNRSYFEKHFPGLQLPGDFGETGWWGRSFEKEPERILRARRFLEELLQRHAGTDHRVGVISHGAFYNRMMNELLQMNSREGLWFLMNNCAITRLDFIGNEVGLIYTNRLEFLPADLVT